MNCARAGLHRARSSTGTATSAGWPRRDPTRPPPRPRPAAPTRSARRAAAAAAERADGLDARSAHGAPRPRPVRARASASTLGAGLVEIEPVPFRDPADAVLGDAAVVPESRRFCAGCDEPVGRGRDGAPGRTAGFCRKCGTPFSFEPQLARRRASSPGQYEVVGCHRPRRHGMDLPGPGPQRVRPVGRAQGAAQLGRRRRDGGGAGRAPLPGRGRAPEHREDLQLRRARKLGLHRHGVRRRTQPQADPHCPPRGRTAARPTRCPRPRRSRTCSRSCPRSATCISSGCCSATSRSTTSSRPSTRSS